MLPDISLDAAIVHAFPLLVSAAWKSTLLFSAGVLVAWSLSRRSAALRHLVWTTAVVGALIVPILEITVPGFSVSFLPDWTSRANPPVAHAPAPQPASETRTPPPPAVAMLEGSALEQAVVNQIASDRAAALSESVSEQTATTAEPTIAAVATSPISRIVVITWLAGVAVLLGHALASFVALKRLERRSEAIDGHPLADELSQAARDQGILRPIRLKLSSRPSIPMTWGIVRPVLLLPREAITWPDAPLRIVLLHELAHIARFDFLTQLVGTIVRALHWYNPLAWWGLSQMKIEQEQACDDCVLRTGTAADVYAFELLNVTSQYPRPRFTPSAALAIGRSAKLQCQLESILDESRNRRPLTLRSSAAVALAGVLMVTGIAPLHSASAGADDGQAAESKTIAVEQAAKAADSSSTAVVTQSSGTTGGQAATAATTAQEGTVSPASHLSEIRKMILNRTVGPIDEKRLDEGAIRGMLQALDDPYSEFLPPAKLTELFRTVEGTLTGIGVQVEPSASQLTVIMPLPGSPARTAGIAPGDAILAVDGKTVRELGSPAAIEAIRGKAGTAVSLLVRKSNSEEALINVTRGAIRVPTIHGLWTEGPAIKWNYWLDTQQKIGYVQILEFGKETVSECQTAIKGLLAEGMKGLVLDLRACPGGLLAAAVEAADLFLREGKIVSVRGSTPETEHSYAASGKNFLGDFPLLVIVDDHTASAAEIFVGALKDNGRATILGMRTFGKGSVQEIHRLGESGAIKLTSAHFFLPSGRRIHRQTGAESWGVDPTEGYTVTLTQEQQTQRVSRRLSQDQLDRSSEEIRGRHEKGPQAVAADIESRLADLQLVAAYKCMSVRLAAGAAPKAGQSEQVVKDYFSHRERLIKARADAQKQIEQIDKELAGQRPGK